MGARRLFRQEFRIVTFSPVPGVSLSLVTPNDVFNWKVAFTVPKFSQMPLSLARPDSQGL